MDSALRSGNGPPNGSYAVPAASVGRGEMGCGKGTLLLSVCLDVPPLGVVMSIQKAKVAKTESHNCHQMQKQKYSR